MSRNCAFPSMAQVEKLLECMEERRYLATGYARTAHARDRTRAAWQDIAHKLNSDGSGCFKTWQQWAKYWKDKKAAVKNKASKIRMARQRTGGGLSDNISLSAIELKIVDLMGGEAFATGDRELEIDPFHPSIVDPPHQINPATQAEQSIILNIQDDTETENATPESESILQGIQSIIAEPGTAQTIQFTATIPDEQQIGRSTERGVQIEYQHIGELLDGAAATPSGIDTPPAAAIQSAVPHRSGHVAGASPRRRLATGRRRVVRRTPPAQRHSQMASLTERFIAIEEKRLENEASIIDNQKKMYEIFSDISKAMSNQTEAIKELCQATRALAENKN